MFNPISNQTKQLHNSPKVDGNTVIQASQFDLHALAYELIAKYKPTLDMDGVFLAMQYPQHQPKCFLGDGEKYRFVLEGLIKNAIKLTKSGSITLFVDGQIDPENDFHLYIAVKDTGVGTVFKNMEAAIKCPENGQTLCEMKNGVENLGGELKFVSNQVQGSVFYFTSVLPIAMPVKKTLTFENISGR